MSEGKKKSEELLVQYEQIRQDMRDYNRSVWQTPSVALTVEIALITIILGPNLSLTPCGKSGVIFAGTLLVVGLLLTFVKHAHFHGLKALMADRLAKQIGMEEEHFPRVRWSRNLKELEKIIIPKGIQGLLVRASAVTWLARFLYIVIAINIYLLVINLTACLDCN